MSLEREEQGEKRPFFATAPVGLTELPVLGREEAFYETFKLLFERWYERKDQTVSDRTQNPFVLFPASPGLGKTRMLNILTRIPKAPGDANRVAEFFREGNNLQAQLDDDELKWVLIQAIGENQRNIRDGWNTSDDKVEEFCDLMVNNSCGILVTFNNRTNLVESELANKVPASEMLGVRIAFEAQLVAGCDYSEFEVFRNRLIKILGDQRPTLDWALTTAFKKIGEEGHIILGVDELLLGAGVEYYEEYVRAHRGRLTDILSALGVELDKRKNLHIVLTSLSFTYFAEKRIRSGRSVRAITLRNLKFEESMALAEWYHRSANFPDEYKWIDDEHARQIVEDCDGAPRLLEKVFEYLKPRRWLKQLRGLCMQIQPIYQLDAKRDRLMIVALVLALRGRAPRDDDERKCFDEAVHIGYLLSSSVPYEVHKVEPIFPLMTMLCLCEKSRLTREDQVFELWEAIQRVLRFDPDTSGNEFEAFFRALWSLRCMTRRFQLYCQTNVGASARFEPEANRHTMKALLTSFDRIPDIADPSSGASSVFDLDLDISRPPQEIRFDGDPPPGTKVTAEEVFVSEGHRILTFSNSDEPGLYDIMTFPLKTRRNRPKGKLHNVGQKIAVFAFHYKFSKPESTTGITNDIIADSLVASVRRNFSVFEPSIEDNFFGFVFVSASPCNDNVNTKAVDQAVNAKVATLQDPPNVKAAILHATSQMAILKREDVLKFIPRPFRSRPQFRLE